MIKILLQRVAFSVDMKHYLFCSIWYQSRGLYLKWNSVRSPKNSKYFIEYCCHHWLLNNTPQCKQAFPCNRFDVKSIAYTAFAAAYRKILWKKAILANISPSIKLRKNESYVWEKRVCNGRVLPMVKYRAKNLLRSWKVAQNL